MNISRIKRQCVFLMLGVVFAPSVHAQSYFDELAARSDVVVAIPFRSQADVQAYWAPNNHADLDYDPVVDSMRMRWPTQGGGSNIDNLAVNLPDISTGNVFFTWDERWGPNWASAGGRDKINGIGTFKNNHVKDSNAYKGGGLMLEIRKHHRKAPIGDNNVPAGEAGYVDIRSYFGNKGVADRLNGIQNDFLLPIEEWTRYFLFVEFGGNGKISLWVTKPGTAPVAVYLQATGDSSGDPGVLKQFQFQHNSSQTYSGPTSYVWNRNLIVLDGVANLAEAQALVNQGANGGPIVRPEPPVLDP